MIIFSSHLVVTFLNKICYSNDRRRVAVAAHSGTVQGKTSQPYVSDLMRYLVCSVADPGCLCRILIFYLFRIPDLKTATKERGETILLSYHTFFCSHKFHKTENYYFLKCWRKNLGQFSKKYRTFYPKIVTKLSKIRVWDPDPRWMNELTWTSCSRIFWCFSPHPKQAPVIKFTRYKIEKQHK
jgi:hypothetical protein